MFTLLYTVIRCIHPISSSLAKNGVTRCHHQCLRPRLCLDNSIKWHCWVICVLAKTYLWKFQFEHLHETTASWDSQLRVNQRYWELFFLPSYCTNFCLQFVKSFYEDRTTVFLLYFSVFFRKLCIREQSSVAFTRLICSMLWRIVGCVHVGAEGT